MKPIASLKDGIDLVDGFAGCAGNFRLAVPEALLDPVGVNMAIIIDRILARGWQPNGFTQHDGFRVFHYTELK